MAGALAVVLVFTRPAFVVFPVLMALAAAWSAGTRPSLGHLSWFLFGAALIFGPITLFTQVHNAPALPAGNLGWQLWLVNNERATGAWFPALDADDYPFKGLATSTDETSLLSAAQQKLALQFIAANPRQALLGVVLRQKMNWANDRMGVYWTVERAPQAWRDQIPFLHRLPDLVDHYYMSVLVLAALAAVRFGRRRGLLIPLILPLIYMVILHSIAEGNDRYHVPALPLLCVLAGAALTPQRRRDLLWVGLALGLVWWKGAEVAAGAWLILIIVLAPIAQSVSIGLWARKAPLSTIVQQHRRQTWLVASLLVVALIAASAGLKIGTAQLLSEVAAVDPAGWQSYHTRLDEPAEPLPLVLQDSGIAPKLRRVSYPDSVLLRFDSDAQPNEVIGLVRTLSGLTVGYTYRFYLQLFVPEGSSAPSENYTLLLNDRIVWRQAQEQVKTAGWRYLSVPWVADASAVTIRIERQAGPNPAASRRAIAKVRTLHLYPKY
jgi:hypothetical protein